MVDPEQAFRFRLKNAANTGRDIVRVKGEAKNNGVPVGTDKVDSPTVTPGNKKDYFDWPPPETTTSISVEIEDSTGAVTTIVLPDDSDNPGDVLDAPDGIDVAVATLRNLGGVYYLFLEIEYVLNGVLEHMGGEVTVT